MATIPTARQKELLELYDDLKKLIFEAEGKYSTDARHITIDFPPTLGLTKLTYKRHSDAEIMKMAEDQVAAKYVEKNRVLDNSYAANVRSINHSRSTLKANHLKKLAALESSYNESVEQLEHKLVDNGLWYSTIKTVATDKETADYEQKVTDEKTNIEIKYNAYADKLASLEESLKLAKTQLLAQQKADVISVAQNIATKEDKEARAVEKYNSSIDEKEAKYQASCQRYLRYAQQAEEERVIAILKLYAQLGATGMEERKLSDVMSTCKSVLSDCTKSEAQFIFSLDSFLQVHLGRYYSALVDWANITLPS